MAWQLIGNIGGKSVSSEDVQAAVTKALSAIPPAKNGMDGRDGIALTGAVIDRQGHLVLTLSDGQTKDVGLVVGPGPDMGIVTAVLREEVSKMPKPKDGKDGKDGIAGLSFEGSYQDGKSYELGHVVFYAGASWHCNEPTSTKPGDSKAWSMLVKRGRDGKDGRDAVAGLPVVSVGSR